MTQAEVISQIQKSYNQRLNSHSDKVIYHPVADLRKWANDLYVICSENKVILTFKVLMFETILCTNCSLSFSFAFSLFCDRKTILNAKLECLSARENDLCSLSSLKMSQLHQIREVKQQHHIFFSTFTVLTLGQVKASGFMVSRQQNPVKPD